MGDLSIIQAIRDSRIFRPLFTDLSTWRAWEVYLKALSGLPIDDVNDRKLLKACTGLKKPPEQRHRESFVICGRRSGKSYTSAIISSYIAAFKDWSPYLSRGEVGWIFVIANDKSQAKIIKNYVSGVFSSNEMLKSLVKRDLTWEIELKSNVTISVKTASFRTLRGYTLLAAILEEIAFWRSEESANPDKEILAAVRPSLATIPDSLLIGISTPYSRAGVLYEQFKRYYGKTEGPLIWQAPTTVMNPTVSKSIIADALRDDPAAARAEWEAEFRADLEAFMSIEFIEAVVVERRYELAKIDNMTYFAFCDPSGGRQDSMTLAIAHKEKDGMTVLDALREQKPPFSPQHVVEEFSALLKAYSISDVEGDRYAGEWVVSAFREHDIDFKNTKLTASEIYLSFLPLVANASVELLDNKRLRVQFAGLERKPRPGGKDTISHYPGAHDDLANAAAGACVMANRGSVYAYSGWSKEPWRGSVDEDDFEPRAPRVAGDHQKISQHNLELDAEIAADDKARAARDQKRRAKAKKQAESGRALTTSAIDINKITGAK